MTIESDKLRSILKVNQFSTNFLVKTREVREVHLFACNFELNILKFKDVLIDLLGECFSCVVGCHLNSQL